MSDLLTNKPGNFSSSHRKPDHNSVRFGELTHHSPHESVATTSSITTGRCTTTAEPAVMGIMLFNHRSLKPELQVGLQPRAVIFEEKVHIA